MGKVQEALKRGELVDQSDLFLELETEREEKKDLYAVLAVDRTSVDQCEEQLDRMIKKAKELNQLLDRAKEKGQSLINVPDGKRERLSLYDIGPNITIKSN